jgi:hypothetical protein
MSGTRCTCGAGHSTFGACMRAKNIHIGDLGHGVARRWDSDLDAYADARKAGIQPSGVDRKSVDRAVRISEASGEAFGG